VTRLTRMALFDAALFAGLVLAMLGIHRWQTVEPQDPALSAVSTQTPDDATVASTETAAEHAEVVPEETPTLAYPPIAPARFLGRGVKLKTYEVKMGENYWSVAKKFSIDIQTLLGANPDMPFVSRVKQGLLVPDKKGVLHAVAKGESLKGIAAQYLTKVDDPAQMATKLDEKVKAIKASNSLPWWGGLREGSVLYLPDSKPVRMNEQWRGYFSQRGFFGMPFASWGKGWSSRYGKRSDPLTGETRMHKGMDFKAKYGADVFASATGTVIFAGVSGGYGNLIQIRHANGYTTYYGHLSKILVKQGQKVKRGTRIGKVGTTGRVTGPHLHFEIRKNGKPINPLPLI